MKYKFKEQGLTTILLIIVCVVSAAANFSFWQTTLQDIKTKLEKYEQLGTLKTVWSVEAKPFEITSGMSLTPEKVSNYLNNSGYTNLSNKDGKCPMEVLRQPKTYCQSLDVFFISSSRLKIFPSLKLVFDRNRKLLKQIFTLDDSSSFDKAVLEPPRIYELEPVRALEKVKVDELQASDGKTNKAQETYENKEVFKQIQPTYRTVQLGRDIKKDDLFIKLLLWLEDRSYFEHNGISYRGGLRAVRENIFGRDDQPTQGSSTISSQVCKQLFSRGKTRSVLRKIEEFYCAAALENHLTATLGSKEAAKIKILELYINLVPLSIEKPNQQKNNRIAEEVIGFGTASELHIGKKLRELNLAESAALLVSVPEPNRIVKQMSSSEMRDEVLKEFAKAYPQYAEEAQNSLGQQIKFKFLADGDLKTDDALMQFTKKKLREQKVFNEANGDKIITVITTIDWQMQAILAKAVETELKNFRKTVKNSVGDKKPFETQADFLAMDSSNGEILNFLSLKTVEQETLPNFQSIEDPIKPGSSIKPLLVTLMIDNKFWTMDKLITPSECRAKDGWQPETASNYPTPDTVRNLLLQSNNPFMNCACRELSPETGFAKLNQFFQRDGAMLERLEKERLASDNENRCRMFWGVSSDTIVSIFDLAAAYTAFPNGVRKQPTLFKQIYLDGEGQSMPTPHYETVFSPEAAAVVADTLQVFAQRKLGGDFKGALMAKTGSTTFSYIFVVVSSKVVFLTHLKIIPKTKDFDKEKVEKIFAGNVAVPMMKESLNQINKNRPQWIEGSFKNNNVLRLRVKDGCVSNDETGEIRTYLMGTEPPPCAVQTEEMR